MNLPNKLTILRIVLSFLFLFIICIGSLWAKILAALLFIIASITDFLDGYYARKYHLISNFGKIMDPIADKFLMLAAFFIFAKMGIIPYWMFALVAFRETSVTIARIYQVKKGLFVAAENSGKVKTVVQIVVILFILFSLIVNELDRISEGGNSVLWSRPIYVMMLTVVIITCYSGIEYFIKNRKSILKKL